MNYTEILQHIIPIARAAGELALRHFRQPMAQTTKASAVDIVTEADKAVEGAVSGELLRLFPGHHFVGEEGGGQGAPAAEADYFWYVDPIDGTTNFANGIPYFSTSIALADRQRRPLVGLVYDPTRDDLYTAITGQGAFFNGQPVRVSAKQDLIEAVLLTGFPHDRQTNPDNNLRCWEAFMMRARAVRCMGSAALDMASVAAGHVDGFWGRSLNPWDVLAGMLLITEAGGTVTDDAGSSTPQTDDTGSYVASNGHLHAAMLAVIRENGSGL